MKKFDTNLELKQFIYQERLSTPIDNEKIYIYFNKCLIKSFIELDIKFNKLKDKKTNVIAGSNMIFHIFYILVLYTNNIKLTIFLLERAILLFTEFLIMSQDKKIIEEICFIPNITDAISFCYKKTIGPLKISNFSKPEYYYVKEISNIMVYIYQIVYNNNGMNLDIYSEEQNETQNEKHEHPKEEEINNKENISLYLNYIYNNIGYILYKLFNKINKNYHSYIINYLHIILNKNDKNEKNVNSKILNIKIILELMFLYINKYKIKNFKTTFDTIQAFIIENNYDYDNNNINNNKIKLENFKSYKLYSDILYNYIKKH